MTFPCVMLMLCLQAIAGVAKQRWRYGLICSLQDDPFHLEQVAKISPQRQHGKIPATAIMYQDKATPTSQLYQTKRVLDENTGKVVMETAV